MPLFPHRGPDGMSAGQDAAGVLLVWCDRPINPRRSPRWRDVDEAKVLVRGFHYLCPLDYAELDIRELSESMDARVILKPCPKCGTLWHGPTLAQLRSRPSSASGPLGKWFYRTSQRATSKRPNPLRRLSPIPTLCPAEVRMALTTSGSMSSSSSSISKASFHSSNFGRYRI